MLKRVFLAAVILSLVFAASMASANNVTLKYDTVANSETPDCTFSVPSTPYYSGGVYAGNYVESYYPPGSQASPKTVSGNCFSPFDSNSSYTSYNLVPITPGTVYAACAWIMSEQSIQHWQPAAAQVAIWQLVFGSYFQVNDWDGVNSAQEATIYADALNHYGYSARGFYLAESLSSPPCQDYIVPVPVPPTLLLLGSGLVGLGGLRWRKGRAG